MNFLIKRNVLNLAVIVAWQSGASTKALYELDLGGLGATNAQSDVHCYTIVFLSVLKSQFYPPPIYYQENKEKIKLKLKQKKTDNKKECQSEAEDEVTILSTCKVQRTTRQLTAQSLSGSCTIFIGLHPCSHIMLDLEHQFVYSIIEVFLKITIFCWSDLDRKMYLLSQG